MRVSAVRFGDDLWQLLESEASRVGVSISQYVREAALARATAAAAARGEEPFELLARSAAKPQAQGPQALHERATAAREAARAAGQLTEGVVAEARQAIEHGRRGKRARELKAEDRGRG